MALNNLSRDLSNLGRREDALQTSQEAVAIRRRLAQDRPDAFLPDLAKSLGARGSIFRAGDDHASAARCFREGVEVLSGPFQRLPAAFAGVMLALVRQYASACDAAGIAPDDDLLAPLVPALKPFMRQPGSDEG